MTATAPSDEPAGVAWRVDEIAQHLKTDPVIVQQLVGNGQTQKVDAALLELASAADMPVFVVVVDQVEGLNQNSAAEELVVLLHSRVDVDGLYAVAIEDGIGSFAFEFFGPDQSANTSNSIATYEAVTDSYSKYEPDEDGPSQSTVGRVAEYVAAATDPDISPKELQQYRTEELWTLQGSDKDYSPAWYDDPSSGFTSMLTTSAFLTATIIFYVVARVFRYQGQGFNQRIEQAQTAVKKVQLSLHNASWPNAVPADSSWRDVEAQAVLAAEKLEKRAADHRASADTWQCLIAADQLYRIALAAKTRQQLYRPCFLNPLHKSATKEIQLTGPVPVCSKCYSSYKYSKGEPIGMTSLHVGSKPYYEQDTLWARTGFGSLSDTFPQDVLAALREEHQQ